MQAEEEKAEMETCAEQENSLKGACIGYVSQFPESSLIQYSERTNASKQRENTLFASKETNDTSKGSPNSHLFGARRQRHGIFIWAPFLQAFKRKLGRGAKIFFYIYLLSVVPP